MLFLTNLLANTEKNKIKPWETTWSSHRALNLANTNMQMYELLILVWIPLCTSVVDNTADTTVLIIFALSIQTNIRTHLLEMLFVSQNSCNFKLIRWQLDVCQSQCFTNWIFTVLYSIPLTLIHCAQSLNDHSLQGAPISNTVKHTFSSSISCTLMDTTFCKKSAAAIILCTTHTHIHTSTPVQQIFSR